MYPELQIDGYKLDHRRQYPNFITFVLSNMTARNTRRGFGHDKVVFVGCLHWIKKILIADWNANFFNKPKEEVLRRFTRLVNGYLGPNNRVGTEHIAALHDLGYLPINILALPEGTVYPYQVPCIVLWNTHPDFFWLTNYLETIMSASIWGICTSATTARYFRRLLDYYAEQTGGDPNFVPFQGHDFSFRGMMGLEAAQMSGFGHLTSFVGTDTIPAISFAEEYYNANVDTELVGCSVPATEHAVMCAGTKEGEIETFERLITELYPDGIVSIVSDTWDFWHVLNPKDGLLVQLKDKVMARKGKVVIRPDTGDPIKIVTGEAKPIKDTTMDELRTALAEGYKYIYVHGQYKFINTGHPMGVGLINVPPEDVTPEMKGAIECLWEIFGGTDTAKNFRLLNEHIGLIYGDSITLERADKICKYLMLRGFASTNIVFGIGSYTYAYVTRDTDGYAVKATYCEVAGEKREIFKEPKTGDGSKKSAKGIVAVYRGEAGEYYMKDQQTFEALNNCALIPVFENGKILHETTLQEIRERIKAHN